MHLNFPFEILPQIINVFSSFLPEEAFLFFWFKQYFCLLQFFRAHWHPKVWGFSSTLLTLCRETGNTEKWKIPCSTICPSLKKDWSCYCNSNLLSHTQPALQKPEVLPMQGVQELVLHLPAQYWDKSLLWTILPPLPSFPFTPGFHTQIDCPRLSIRYDEAHRAIWTQPW